MEPAQLFNKYSASNLERKREEAYKTKKFDEVPYISYENFFLNYLIPNRPCIFTAELTETWQSRKKWVLSDGSPNFAYLAQMYGAATVPVANCHQQEYSAHPKQDMKMSRYLEYWQTYKKQGYPDNEACYYLKDWHFTKAFPEEKVYTSPIYFQSDWLNEYWDTLPDDDYRFVYMGPKGTWTPFHSDVYRSHSWSANICGRKRWIFFPPGAEKYLQDRCGHLIYDVMSPDLCDVVKYPNVSKVKDYAIEVIQEQGQVVFVPSGWHHQVYNLVDTISINHNWLNGCNIDLCWRHLQCSLEDVQKEISDCQEMEGWAGQCQVILNASAGMDYRTFVHLLSVIAEHRLLGLDVQLEHGLSCLDVPPSLSLETCSTDTCPLDQESVSCADEHSCGGYNVHVHEKTMTVTIVSNVDVEVRKQSDLLVSSVAALTVEDESEVLNHQGTASTQLRLDHAVCDTCPVPGLHGRTAVLPDTASRSGRNRLDSEHGAKFAINSCTGISGHVFDTHGEMEHSGIVNYQLYDLYRISNVLRNICDDVHFQLIDNETVKNAHKLLCKLNSVLGMFKK